MSAPITEARIAFWKQLYDAATTERDQLRAEVERLRAGIEECLHTNAHLADGEDCTLIGLKRCLRDSRVERSDAEQVDVWASWASTCMHHNDAERGRCGRVCPVCITAERDQLRVDLELADVMYQRACEVEHELRTEVERLRSDRDCEKRLRKDAEELREDAIERAMKAEADASTYLQRANSFRKLSDEAEAECLEQARLLGKGAEREADLIGKVERLELENKRLRTALAFISAVLREDTDMSQAECIEKSYDYAYAALQPKNLS